MMVIHVPIAPPTPSPGASDGPATPSPSPSVTVSPSPAEELPVTGVSDVSWGLLVVGLALALIGAALIARFRRSRA